MKLILSLILLLSFNCFAQYDSHNINFLGRFYDSTVVAEPVYGIKYQACWGWADSIGNEYGIIGSSAGTYIVNITNPSNPVMCDYVPHHQTNLIWHEYKTYGNLLYIISDNIGTGFQIADLSYLPDSVHLVYDNTALFEHAHTISLDGNKMYLGSVSKGPFYSSMNVYSLANPAAPVLLRQLSDDYPFISQVHDMFVINDTVYASCGYEGLYIFIYDSVANQFQLLSSLQDNTNIYNHSSCLSPDHQYLYMCEEVPPGQPVKIIDVSNIFNPFVDTTFTSNPGVTPHNPSVKDDKLIMANYMDGVYIYDINDPANPVQIGFFDTYPFNAPGVYPPPGYAGCWSTYNDLPSGILLAGDMQSGLFMLDISGVTKVEEIVDDNLILYPNPANDQITVKSFHNSMITIYDHTGKLILSFKAEDEFRTIDISILSPGLYNISVATGEKTVNKNFIVQ